MEGTGYCMGCMHKLDWDGRCHYCGFDERNYKKDQQLGLHTRLKNGEYMIGRQLGQGGFGITYIGMDTTLLQTVAIKEYFPFGAVRRNDRNEIELYDEKYRKDYEKGLESFLCEGRILARFSNLTAVVGVKNFFHENNTAYLVMDYVEGLSVREYVKNYGVLSPDRTLFLVQQVIADMQMIHHKQVLHRDVSADNLIITHNGSLKLIDFGATRQEFTKNQYTGTILCKQGYSAIEQYSTGRNQGPWTDIYGLCASIYFMLTGVVPDSAPDRIQNDCVRSLVQMDEIAMPKVQKEAIMKGLAVEVEHRYHTMAELYVALYGEKLEDISGYYERENNESALREKESPAHHALEQKSVSRTKMKRALQDIEEDREKGKKRKRRLFIYAVVVICLLFAVGVGRQFVKNGATNGSDKENDRKIEKKEPSASDQPTASSNDTAQNKNAASHEDENNNVTDQSTEPKSADSAEQGTKSANPNNSGLTEQNSKEISAKNSAEQNKKSTSTKSSTTQSKKSTSTKSSTTQGKKASASTKNSNFTTQSKKASAKNSSSTTKNKKSTSTKNSTAQSKKSTSKKSTSKQQTTSKKANSLENIEKSSKDDSNVAGDLGE
ncbi:MAG: hypothetical protein DBY27_08600 [Clostridiaceae bacterium]|nr:MAG: hypothetical protein DBY27_08600 [Clostridiaceae bacterium]